MTQMPTDPDSKGMHIYPEPIEEEQPLASATEMTGLIPSGAPDEAERESYRRIFPYLAPPEGA